MSVRLINKFPDPPNKDVGGSTWPIIQITNHIGRELTGITSENSMKDVFYRLRDRTPIERVPGREGPRALVEALGIHARVAVELLDQCQGKRSVAPCRA